MTTTPPTAAGATGTIRPVPRRDDLTVRRAEPGDEPAIVALAGTALGWDATGPHLDLFRWKHRENPFGTSPMWVAEEDGRLVGFRTFLRWSLRLPGGTCLAAVRAVDTATHPDAQGRGIFTRLTELAVEELRADGVACVFNTPNANSRPGYLKMGWRQLGRIAVAVIPGSPRRAVRMVAARQPAEKWSLRSAAGVSAPEFFADSDAVARLLASLPAHPGIATPRDPGFLAWRYGFAPLAYRCLPLGDRVEDGALIVRVRRRGGATEATLCDVLVPSPARARVARALLRVPRETDADYALLTRATLPRRALPLPGQGPVLTWRAVADPRVPTLDELAFTLGDLELF